MDGVKSYSADSSVNLSAQDNGIEVDGGFSTEVTNARGYGLSFGISGEAELTSNLSTENGVTTYTAAADVSLTVEGGVTAPQGGVQAQYTLGVRGEYTVSMPEELATSQAIATVNPYDPSTMPPGTTLTVNGENYQSTAFEATFRGISSSSQIQTSSGASFMLQMQEDGTLQVMTGPTEGLEAVQSLGLDLGVASAALTSTLSVEQARYQVANFDIATPEGLAAYNAFLTTGQMPADNAAGVSNVHTISTLETDWNNAISLSVGPVSIGGQLDSSEGDFVTIAYPDGSATATSTYRATDGGPTMIWEQSFGPDGQEILEDRRYSYVFDIPEGPDGELLATQLNYALNGRSEEVASAGESVTLTFTEEEMAQLLEMAASQSQQDIDYGEYRLGEYVLESEPGSYAGNHADSRLATPWEFANNISHGNMWEVAGALADISTHAGEGVSLDLGDRVDVEATVVVDGEVVVEGEAAQAEASGADPTPASGGGGRPMAMV